MMRRIVRYACTQCDRRLCSKFNGFHFSIFPRVYSKFASSRQVGFASLFYDGC